MIHNGISINEKAILIKTADFDILFVFTNCEIRQKCENESQYITRVNYKFK